MSGGGVSRFDGVALVSLETGDIEPELACAELLRALPEGMVLLDGSRRAARAWVPGVGAALPADAPSPDPVALVPLTRVPRGSRRRTAVDLARVCSSGQPGRWRAARIAWMSPAVTEGWTAVRPLAGGRTHLVLPDESWTACGRLPAHGPPGELRAADCPRCLRSPTAADAFHRQLGDLEELADLVGPLAAATAARLWPRLAHLSPETCPPLLDGMVGSLLHRRPGAPSVTETLTLLGRHASVASPPVRRWAAQEARRLLASRLARITSRHPARLDAGVASQLRLVQALLPTREAATALVDLLERFGPAPAMEPLVLETVRGAGTDLPERVEQWRRRHEVAAALSRLGG